jgi:NAD-dependent dihydropyrimidine dehydrogenase PreA subunit
MALGCTPTPPGRGGLPRSRTTRWRFGVLIGVHVLAAIHIAHWQAKGTSLSPLEPSEAMEFTQRGVINAGLVLFALAALSTLVLGRFFCGWACHLVALQDLCRALMLRAGIRPRPLRSRTLALVPLLAFGYMFLLPLVTRPHSPTTSIALTTTDYWRTFPPWWGALITLAVCGFGVVYLLGAKGFCTYACPYGALFGVVDRLSPGRIRVTDACDSCGFCTASCTSNVNVKTEVARHGMVVDAGCMKCLDCVSVCPKDALYFGFGKPAGIRRALRAGRSLAWTEELLASVAFVWIFLVTRGLYGVVPFLLALGLGGTGALLGLVTWRLVRGRDARLPGITLRRAGRVTGMGWALLVLTLAGLGLLGHSSVVQWHGWRSARAFAQLEQAREDWFSPRRAELDESQTAAAREVLLHGRRALDWGLLPNPHRENEVGWALLLADGDGDGFTRHLERVAAGVRRPAMTLLELGNHARSTGDLPAAAERYRAAFESDPSHPFAGEMLRNVEDTLASSRRDEQLYRAALERSPTDLPTRAALVEALLAQGARDSALEVLEQGARLAPLDPAPLRVLAYTYMVLGDREQALATCERARSLPDPDGETRRLWALIEGSR